MAVVKAGNKVVLDPEGSYIENKLTKERIKLIEVGDTFVFDIEPDQAMVMIIALRRVAGIPADQKRLKVG